MKEFEIAVFPGDGIGVEVMDAAEAALEGVERRFGFRLARRRWGGGAAHWRETGRELEEGAFEAARRADAILFGSMGLPDVRLPDGTEIAPHLEMRREFGLFAGVRPARKYPNTPTPLGHPEAEGIDLIVLRESTEGLFASRGRGTVERDAVARDTMEITRATSEKLFDFAFRLAERRAEKGRGRRRVTCVDKSNVFVSMAFFRRIFDERRAAFPQVRADHAYVDAAALDLVRKPWTFDVMVMENMFGDILSDLCGGLVGGMGMGPLRRDRAGARALPARPRHRARHRRAGPRQPHGDAGLHGDDARLARGAFGRGPAGGGGGRAGGRRVARLRRRGRAARRAGRPERAP